MDLSNPEKVKGYIAVLERSIGYKDARACKTRVPKAEDIEKIGSHSKLNFASVYSVIREYWTETHRVQVNCASKKRRLG